MALSEQCVVDVLAYSGCGQHRTAVTASLRIAKSYYWNCCQRASRPNTLALTIDVDKQRDKARKIWSRRVRHLACWPITDPQTLRIQLTAVAVIICLEVHDDCLKKSKPGRIALQERMIASGERDDLYGSVTMAGKEEAHTARNEHEKEAHLQGEFA